MLPAFSSTKQAASFGLLLLLVLLLPALAGKSLLPPRDQIYSSLHWGAGAYPYLHDQIFEEKGDIDIAFMGPSSMWWAIDTPQVEAQLSQQLGRKAVVRSLCWNSPGCDPFYFILQDLLQHRRVHCVVFSDCSTGSGNTAQSRAQYFFRMADNHEALAGLTWRSRISFYTSAILGTPRNLLGLLRPNLPPATTDKISWSGGGIIFTNIINPALRLGSLTVPSSLGRAFESYAPHTGARPEDVRVYSDATRDDFHFEGGAIPPMQAAFLQKAGALAREQHVRLVYLHLPKTTEMKSATIEELAFWPDVLRTRMTMMGIAPAKLFEGLNDDDISKLFYNFEHLNENGQKYFTSIIGPALARVYENQAEF